jgi:hypothetical protein
MSYSVTLKRLGATATDSAVEATVTYAAAGPLTSGALAEPVVLRAAALPDPPPEVIRITLDWAEAVPARTARTGPRSKGAAAIPVPARSDIHKGDQVKIVKSRVSGVKSPPEWLEQYVGRTGLVLWTTADGAMVDLDGAPAWFSFAELLPND